MQTFNHNFFNTYTYIISPHGNEAYKWREKQSRTESQSRTLFSPHSINRPLTSKSSFMHPKTHPYRNYYNIRAVQKRRAPGIREITGQARGENSPKRTDRLLWLALEQNARRPWNFDVFSFADHRREQSTNVLIIETYRTVAFIYMSIRDRKKIRIMRVWIMERRRNAHLAYSSVINYHASIEL